jgi:hypothetical protein
MVENDGVCDGWDTDEYDSGRIDCRMDNGYDCRIDDYMRYCEFSFIIHEYIGTLTPVLSIVFIHSTCSSKSSKKVLMIFREIVEVWSKMKERCCMSDSKVET